MIARAEPSGNISAGPQERISYIRQMLGELARIARTEQAELLVYLLEMAYTEAGDMLAGKSVAILHQVKRDKSGGMSV